MADATLSTDREEALLRGYIPIDKEILEILKSGKKIEEIMFAGNGYFTDAVLHLLGDKSTSKDVFARVKKVDLLGCSLVTDYGIRALIPCLQAASSLLEINLSGCELLTDSTYSMIMDLIKNDNKIKCIMKGTSVSLQTGSTYAVETSGCPVLLTPGETTACLQGQVLIVPHHGLKTSIGEYLCLGNVVETKGAFHRPDLKVGDWTMAVTEILPSSYLLDNMVSMGCSQVIIPFDASSDPKDIAQHVMTTISKVVAKEPVWHKMDTEGLKVTKSQSSIPFLDTHLIAGLELTTDTGGRMIVRNISLNESMIGVYCSRERFTRSNSYVEVVATRISGTGKIGLLMGCMYDVLISERNPMDSTSDVGGMVDGFEVGDEDKIVGFGIEGEWLSEYVPSPDAQFYFLEDGVKSKGKNPDPKLTPNGSMYPIFSVLGESMSSVRLPPFVQPPQELANQWKKENKWIEKGFSHDCLVDKDGRITYCRNYSSSGARSLFLGRQEIRESEKFSFSIVVEEMSALQPTKEETDFSIGLAGEFFKTLSTSPKDLIYTLTFNINRRSKWTCDKCEFENEKKDAECRSCKNGKNPNKSTIKVGCEARNAKASNDAFKSIEDIKIGDTFTVRGSLIGVNLQDQDVRTVNMVFLHNDTEIFNETVEFTVKTKSRIVPFIGMKYGGGTDVLRLKNYKPTYRRPAPYRDKITLGRCHYLNVMDDGECEFKNPFPENSKTYGWFMSKAPFNKELLEFSVDIITLDSHNLFGIGVTEPDFTENSSFVGWKQDQMGYHADNGKVYHNDGTGTMTCSMCSEEPKLEDGDTVSVKIVPQDDQNPLQFDDNGDLKCQQTMKIQFYKNKTLMHEKEHKFCGEGIYPAFSTKNSTVKIHNFYPETAALWEDLTRNGETTDLKNTSTSADALKDEFQGTEFLIVGVTNGSSDPAGKLQMLQQQIEQMDKSTWNELTNVATAISEMEKDFSVMDLQEQQRYGLLRGIHDNMTRFTQHQDTRLRYLVVDCNTDDDAKFKKGRETMLQEMEKVERRLMALQPLRYKTSVANDGPKLEDVIINALSTSKVLEFEKMFELVPDLKTAGKDGRTVAAMLKLLQSRGKLLLLDVGHDMLVVDIEFILGLEEKLWLLSPADLVKTGTTVTCIGDSSHVWDNKAVDTNILGDIALGDNAKKSLLRLLLEKCLGLIRVPCLRTKPDQEHSVYVIQQNVTTPPKPMADFWRAGKENIDFVVMKQSYSFPLGLSEYVLPLIISNTTKYGHMLLLTGGGVVYQNGAVQTVIIRHQEPTGRELIIIESQCYMPDLTALDDARMTKVTPSYVKDYTWSVFCVFTDIVDDLLQRSNIVAMVTKAFSPELVNVSVGCKHSWINNTDCSVVQSVCTLCNRCCGKEDCPWNGIMGEYFRQSGCCADKSGCKGCGICISCAQELWGIRSRLRPHGNSIMEVQQNINEKTTKKKPAEEKDSNKPNFRDPLNESIISLDPYIYNEVEFTNLSADAKILCLKEESDGTILKAFPGLAGRVQDLGTVPLTGNGPDLLLQNGDQIKIRLTDPLGASLMVSEESKATEALHIEPQYFACIGREVKVIHETGIVLYDTASSALPVGQLISVRPMTKEFDTFSIRVLAVGDSSTIALGLAPQNYPPNRQPGWNAKSIGYHADDGGVYLESGWPTRKTKTCAVGDIMAFFIDFTNNKGFFWKNGEKIIELNLNFNKLSCYPIIGLHSPGEAVEILDKEFWQPKTEQDRNLTPPAFATYKYGNLWISPGDKMTFTKLASKLTAWIVLHNPTKDPVGFKVRCDGVGSEGLDLYMYYYGVIQHKKDWLTDLKIPTGSTVHTVIVEWASLESGRTYTEEEMKVLFGTTDEQINQSSHQHKLLVSVTESDSSVESLQRVASGTPKDQKSLCMQVYRNLRLVDEYWLKCGNYQVSVEAVNKRAKFILKYPKCPSFTYPRGFQKGMKLVIYMESENAYAECVVVEVYPGGRSLALEYSPKDRTSNMTICMTTSSSAFKFSEFDKDQSYIIPYETRNTPSSLTRTFVNAPPYLLSEGAKKTLDYLYPEWKVNMLRSMADCSQVFTRITVQEQQIWNAAKLLLAWYPEGYDGHLFTFLPSQLTQSKLMYPHPAEMFADISIHRLCFAENELILSQSYFDKSLFEMPLKIALHYVDIPGLPPDKVLPVDVLFGEGLNVWTYVALVSSRLFVPSYKKLIPDDSGTLSCGQIEHLLNNMVKTYTSLCGIYSASWGGIQYTPMNDVRAIKKAIKHQDKYLVHSIHGQELDAHVLCEKDGYAICKAHLMNYGIESSYVKEEMEFKYEYFEPYTDLVTIFYWCHEELKSLPDDFFKRFSQLVHFQLGRYGKKMAKFTKLPDGIGSANRLRNVEITNLAVEHLPEDLFLGKHLETLTCSNLPVKSLPSRWPDESKISEFTMSGLLITKIPEEIGKLSEIKDLDICHNPITDLPEALKNLKKLTALRLQGCMWLTLEGKRSQITHQQFNTWHSQNPYIKYNLGDDKVDKMFTEYDYNHNGSLDEEELAQLNMEVFFKIHRLGITDINDEVTGGIPPVIFNLKSLCELYLDYNAITMVPQAINNLQNLKVLNLSHNPLLESLPGSLGHLPNIKQIHIQSCPMLRTPPIEVVSRGFEPVKAYLKRLAGGFTECRRTKLMVVGLGGAGKTSLLRALMSEKKMTQGTSKEIPTDGIDIVPWTVSSEDGREITYSTWDFAGQAVYYNTHQFFLSKRAVYLLLWSMRQGYEHAGLDFWLSSICCHAPGTPIIVIGTQCDLIPKAEIPEKELIERYPQIASFHQVSAIKGIGIEELQKSLLDVTLLQGYMGEKIPQVWLNFERRIIAERLTKKSYIKWEVARAYAMEQGIYDEKDVRLAIQLLHDLGTVQYFDNDFLRDYVVINPQWIVNVMACVVSAQDSPIQKNHGRFLHSDILTIWKDYETDLHLWLLRLTEDFDLTFPLPKEPVNIVPCLLPGEPPEDLKWPSIRGKEGIRETKMVYRFTYLPSGLFNRAQVRLFQFSDGKMVWKKGSLLSKNKHLALIKQTDNTELVVYVQGPRPENILFLIHEVFESIIEESFNGVSYELFLPCPDCVTKEGTNEPDLLNAKLIERAKDLKAPFIQCYKYFHWISMSQLQEKMPANSREVADFDFQLQQSVVALQELNNDLVVDTAILYSMADIPGPEETDKLPPSLVRDDILSWGHTCWFSEDMDNVSVVDMTAAIKNCKILLVFISDGFERDSKCRDMFLYAKETMNKDIIIIVMGHSLEWQNKDLGMKIGTQERKLMAKTRERYEIKGGRRDELKIWLSEKLLLLTQETILPDVFISYNWSNSSSASEKSGRMHTESLGWGDPRQLKSVLQEHGISCWIDTEFIGKEKKGIFADMAAGIRNSKVILAFISDEYAESDNCMMELRFGIINMELPLVAVIVGTKSGWKQTEVAMLLRRALANEVYLQNENPEGIKVMVKFVQDALEKVKLSGPQKKNKAKDLVKQEKDSKPETKSSSVAYQEEVELIQRKFMRHILGSIIALDTMPLPRLIVVDFVKSGKYQKTDDGRDSSVKIVSKSSRKMLRPKTATKSRDRLQVDADILDEEIDDWTKESLCIRVLCEHEWGWHICDEMYPLAFRKRDVMEQFLTKSAPYLYRIYTILKQGPIKLKCFSAGKGDAFQKWIRSESEEDLDFVGAMMHLRSHLATDEAADFLSCLSRCRLPSGKIVWLCKQHQKEEHVAKLSTGSTGSSYNLTKVLFNEDKFFLEHMEKSSVYKKLKGIKSKKVAPKLPKPIPIPVFMSPAAPKAEDIDKSEQADKDDKKSEENAKDEGPTSTTGDVSREEGPTPRDEGPISGGPSRYEGQTGQKTANNTNQKQTMDIEAKKKLDDMQSENKEPQQKEDKNISFDENLGRSERMKNQTENLPNRSGITDENAELKDQMFDKANYDKPGKVSKTKDEAISEVTELEEQFLEAKVMPEDAIKVTIVKSKKKEPVSEKEQKEIEKEKIMRMILQSDSRALSKAINKSTRRPHGQSISQRGFNILPSDMRTLQRNQSSNNFANVVRGSNVKRTQAETEIVPGQSRKQSESRTSSQSSSANLESTLHIQTVRKTRMADNDGRRDVHNETRVRSKGSGKSSDSEKGETHPLDRVRPKKIKVQPRTSASQSTNNGTNQNMTATGIGIGVPKGADMPLQERTDSKACLIQ